jgi:hypothetical protein
MVGKKTRQCYLATETKRGGAIPRRRNSQFQELIPLHHVSPLPRKRSVNRSYREKSALKAYFCDSIIDDTGNVVIREQPDTDGVTESTYGLAGHGEADDGVDINDGQCCI